MSTKASRSYFSTSCLLFRELLKMRGNELVRLTSAISVHSYSSIGRRRRVGVGDRSNGRTSTANRCERRDEHRSCCRRSTPSWGTVCPNWVYSERQKHEDKLGVETRIDKTRFFGSRPRKSAFLIDLSRRAQEFTLETRTTPKRGHPLQTPSPLLSR